MRDEDFAKLREDVEVELLRGGGTLALLGLTRTALRLVDAVTASGLVDHVAGIFTQNTTDRPQLQLPVRPMAELAGADMDVVAVASDADKQELLLAALPYLSGSPKVIVAGYGHLAFRDLLYQQELAGLLVPSLARQASPGPVKACRGGRGGVGAGSGRG